MFFKCTYYDKLWTTSSRCSWFFSNVIIVNKYSWNKWFFLKCIDCYEILQFQSIHCLRLSFQFHCKICNEIFRLMRRKMQKSIWKRFSVLWRDHSYIKSALFWPFFTPLIHLISIERQQTGHFLDPPTQSFSWGNIGMVSNELPIMLRFWLKFLH
jgi:hypothetical protein